MTDDKQTEDYAAHPQDDSSDAGRPSTKHRQKVAIVDRDSWLNTKLLKILGIVYGIASPFIIWLIVTIYGHNTELAILKLKQEAFEEKMLVIKELNTKIDQMNASITRIQIDIATIKAKVGIQ
jgi:hypothetical protein